MKHYLDLIPISAKIHRKQTLMTRLCIVISVFLIAAIFGMADMFLQSQKNVVIQSDGAWHVLFRSLNEEQIALINARPEVRSSACYAEINYRLDMGYAINGTQTALCGFDEPFFELLPAIHMKEGAFPQNDNEALVSESVRDRLGFDIGDTIEITTPDEPIRLQISGFIEDPYSMQQSGAFGVFLNTHAYRLYFQDETLEEDFFYFVEFVPHCRIQDVVKDICEQLNIPADAVIENNKLMGLLLQSSDGYILTLYLVAVILAVLVAFAGMLMILGSLNSNVAQRTEFFGMMRCLGATGKQVRRFVRLEALSWCKTAIPLGLISSIAVVWILCGMLKAISPTYFGGMPNFGISWIGLVTGCVIGLLTVLAASRTPAKKASKVSPLTAVSGNADTVFAAKRAANTRLFPVDTALGIHHATGSKKNLFLLTASFAFGIILFLSFSTGVDFMYHAITPLRSYTPDVSVVSPDNSCTIPDSLLAELKENPAVNRIFGRSFSYDLPIEIHGENRTVNLISYETYQFGWAADDVLEGRMESVQNGEGVFTVANPEFTVQTGDEIVMETKLGLQTVTIAGILSYAPFNSGGETGTLICSEELFRRLTGESGYTILDLQLKDRSDSAVEEIRNAAGSSYNFADRRASNSEVRAAYYSFALFVYGFLAIVALIAAFNIINSIGMSVSARMRQYGAMRAIGTSIRQLKSMVVAETSTYLICGLITGLALGLPLHHFLYREMITARWGDAWSLPAPEFCIIAAVMIVSAIIAVIGPVQRINKMSIVETISAQ
ncbi:MAG: ABC transporter permease [Acetatifactor sp.]|nr:ABC transporter permease [Acetatifactor sp.]